MKIENIKNIIKNTRPYINGWEKMNRASVIIPLVEINNEVFVLFEVRSKKLRTQPGDICFPGGKIDNNETPKIAGLREIYEELKIKNIDIINQLDIFVRYDGLLIHPFVAIINDIKEIVINENEVDHIFYVPLNYLIKYKPLEVDSKIIVDRSKDFPYELIVNNKNYKFRQGFYKSLFYKYNDYVIWGITAEILRNFVKNLSSHPNTPQLPLN